MLLRLAAAAAACLGLPASAIASGVLTEPRIVHAITVANQLIRFDAAQPGTLLDRRPIRGLAAGESLVGLDFRVARNQLYGLGSTGQLYRIDPATAVLTPIGSPTPDIVLPLDGVGFDFNPTVDRIRVVTASGLNLRLHPETGALIDGDAARDGVQSDGKLRFDSGDRHAGQPATVGAAGYTYNKDNEKLTSNFAIDTRLGWLLLQGSPEGAPEPVSPNTGRLTSVGPLGTGPLVDATFDIADLDNEALLGTTIAGQTMLMRVDLRTGRADALGRIGNGEPLRGLAIAP